MQNKQSQIPMASAMRSGMIHIIFHIEKSIKKILHQKLQGASPATNARKIQSLNFFGVLFCFKSLFLIFIIDCMNIYILKKKSIIILILCMLTMYSVGS
jgi:hypothetical protein